MTLTGRARPFEEAVKFAFYVRSFDDLHSTGRLFTLTPEDISRLNPNTRTCPVFQSARDASLVADIYRRIPVLVNEETRSDEWQLTIRRILDMNKAKVLAVCTPSSGEERLPLLPVCEAKLMDHFNHRSSTYEVGRIRRFEHHELEVPHVEIRPRYWLPEDELVSRLSRFWDRKWLLVWQDVTDVNTMSRTVISAILPLCGTDFTLRVGFPRTEPATCAIAFAGNLNSFVFDYIARQKIGGTHLSDYILRQLPVLPPERYKDSCPWGEDSGSLREWLLPRVLELIFTSWNLKPFAEDCNYEGPPFHWDEERRFLLRVELDAAFFHLYLGPASEWQEQSTPELLEAFPTVHHAVDYIMETFPIVKRRDIVRSEVKNGSGEVVEEGHYITKDNIIKIYDQIQKAMDAGEHYVTQLDPPPGPPVDADGNFLPLPEWKPGEIMPEHWPSHIHAPRGIMDPRLGGR